MRLLTGLGVVVLLCVTTASRHSRRLYTAPSFVSGPNMVKGRVWTGSTSMKVLAPASGGSFVVGKNIMTLGGRGSPRQRRPGGGGPVMIYFTPPSLQEIINVTTKAILWGGLMSFIPVWTRERLREKEEGMATEDWMVDEGYLCATCDNTNQVQCKECGGKGFFVSDDALPRKCEYCGGLGTLECPMCQDRREEIREMRLRRQGPFQLPPENSQRDPWS
ncbi:unnamed protein product [Choristocarpus tenellus]